jgi:hypothetical protein
VPDVLRNHPHLQGLLLGTALLASAVGAAPFAVDAVRAVGSHPTTSTAPGQEAAPAP